jgi:anhydro-N-acetylmuramic acid kinase
MLRSAFVFITLVGMTKRLFTSLGLMSGTSLDGIDVALIRTDGENQVDRGAFLSVPYRPETRALLRSVFGGKGDVAGAEQVLTDLHRAAVLQFLETHGLSPSQIDLIGFHGQTIFHAPDQGKTWQIGDGAQLAQAVGIRVVNDFRSADVAAGGQGAPLVPIYHQALAANLPKPLAVLNIGGVANVTWLGAGAGDAILAFDTGPGGALLDDWVLQKTGQPFDADGAFAATGRVDAAVLQSVLSHPYFSTLPPKSLDRDAWAPHLWAHLSAPDGAATLTALTVQAVVTAALHLPHRPLQWLVCGGGRKNTGMMAQLASALAVPVSPVETVGWNGDALEAEAFAYLAVRRYLGLPISLPTTTGVAAPTCGGRIYPQLF